MTCNFAEYIIAYYLPTESIIILIMFSDPKLILGPSYVVLHR